MSLSTYAMLLAICFIFPPAIFPIVGFMAFKSIPVKPAKN